MLKRRAGFISPRFTTPPPQQPQVPARVPAQAQEGTEPSYSAPASTDACHCLGSPGDLSKLQSSAHLDTSTATASAVVPVAGFRRRPLVSVLGNAPASLQPKPEALGAIPTAKYWTVLYCKKDMLAKKKASKKYADGVLQLMQEAGSFMASLQDTDGKVIFKGKARRAGAADSQTYEAGSWSIEADRQIDAAQFRSGACFLNGDNAHTSFAKPLDAAVATAHRTLSFRPVAARTTGSAAQPLTSPPPLHDPYQPEALILNEAQWQHGKGKLMNGRPVVAVVVDPYLARKLRPHQQEGVRFLYECVMGMRQAGKGGALLADEMGLGKTLQVIALLWTLLRQGPEGRPAVGKAVVVVPASLVNNWAEEVRKWLGSERLQAFTLPAGAEAALRIEQFKLVGLQRLLISSYDALRKHSDLLVGICDLLVCDEGHRLKAVGGNKTIAALQQLQCSKRIVLTGTPVQNDLLEFFALMSFVVPEVLGTLSVFKRVYADPITKSRDSEANKEDKELGAARAVELQRLVSAFVLRRTQDLLTSHLPPLRVHVLFCKPSTVQVDMYRTILQSQGISSLVSGGAGEEAGGVLGAITLLKKLCNHPVLLSTRTPADVDEDLLPLSTGKAIVKQAPGSSKASTRASSGPAACLDSQVVDGCRSSISASGKVVCLQALLESIIAARHRAVVVSGSTAALDMIERLVCHPSGFCSVRIDGSTNVDERQGIVNNFNRGVGQICMLSTRAGGAGLNLIGANHLVLFDSDWNPAMDLQAMARIWRDGQTKPCHVYRMLTTGTIEEKVYQRQLMKSDLASVTAGQGGGPKFTRDELRQLFQLTLHTPCETRDLLQEQSEGLMHWHPQEEVTALAAMAAAGSANGTASASGEDGAIPAAASTGMLTAVSTLRKALLLDTKTKSLAADVPMPIGDTDVLNVQAEQEMGEEHEGLLLSSPTLTPRQGRRLASSIATGGSMCDGPSCLDLEDSD